MYIDTFLEQYIVFTILLNYFFLLKSILVSPKKMQASLTETL